MAVVAFHFLTHYAENWGHAPGFWLRFPLGHYGVELFFMVSGFVILMTISRVKTSVEFAVNRFARLYPVYWAAVSFTFLCVSVFPIRPTEAGMSDYLVNLTMLNNVLNPFLPVALRIRSVDGAYWSLQPELFFYGLILLPFLLCRLRRLELWILGWLLISLITGLLPHSRVANGFSFLLNLRYADLFAAGMIFFLARSRGVSLFNVSLLGLCLLNRFVIGGWIGGVVVLGFYCLFGLLHADMVACLRSRALVFLGAISYSLYLVHQNLGYILIHRAYGLGISPWISVPVAVAVVLLVATGLTYLVEKPANRALRRAYGAHRTRKSTQPAPQIPQCGDLSILPAQTPWRGRESNAKHGNPF